MDFLTQNFSDLVVKLGEHFIIALLALALGVLVAMPIGIFITKNGKLSSIVMTIASILQTIPSLALLSIMVPLVGVGKKPAIIALFIY